MKRKINIPFTFVAALLILTACGNSSNPDPTYNDPNRHHVKDTLHDIDYDFSSFNNFVVNGKTDYYIAVTNADGAQKAAEYIAAQVKSATGCVMTVKTIGVDDVISSSETAIIIGSDKSFEASGIKKTDKNIGITGYQLETLDKAVYLVANGSQGFQLGCLKFLEITLGYDLLYGDFIVFDEDGSKIPTMHIVERPDFDYRKIDDLDITWRYGAGFTDNNVFGTIGNQQYHNSFKYISPDLYYKDHPNWFNTKIGPDDVRGQLCYTAHSHPEEVEQMVDIAAKVFIENADKQPDVDNFTFTIQDNYNMCDCYGDPDEGWTQTNPNPDSCLGKRNKYNGSNAGVTIEFVNKLDDKIQAHYNGSREIHLSIFAYHGTEIAPAKLENGKYVAIDNLKTNPDVAVFCAFISSNFTNSFYDEEKNSDANYKAKSWEAISNRLYSWIYETNFYDYFYPFNTFTSMCETYRYLKEHSNSLVYTQGQHTASNRTSFNKLKLYLSSKLMINVNVDVEPLIDKFFDRYYGEGSSYMRQFYEEMVSWCEYQEVRWPKIFKGGVSSGNGYLATADYWNEAALNKWENLVYKAIEAIEPIKDQDAYKYQLMSDSMLGESIFPRWGLYNLFSGSYTSSGLIAKRKAFMEDCKKLNFDEYGENKTLADFFVGSWGL